MAHMSGTHNQALPKTSISAVGFPYMESLEASVRGCSQPTECAAESMYM